MKKQIKNIKIPLFWKFATILVFIVLIFGLTNIFLLWNSVYNSFEKEIDKRCTVLAKIVAEKSLSPLVYEDYLSLHNILDEIKQSDPSISYAFILNEANEIIAHTYEVNIPYSLINVNSHKNGKANIQVIKTNNFKYPVIRDIAYPILNGDIGTVRLGIVEEQIQEEITEVTYRLILMISAFLVFGLFGALFFSLLITTPIRKISKNIQHIDLKNIETIETIIPERKKLNIFNIQINDEMDILVSKLTDMISRLKRSRIELKESQEALIQADKLAALGTLSAGVAHEINNPISGIKNCINRINKDQKNIEQNTKYIVLIKDAVGKIEGVVSRLLTFSRKQDIKFEKININKVIENSIKLTSHKLITNNVSTNLNYTEEYFVTGDFNHLEQVFVNLILNSLDAIIEKKENYSKIQGEISISINSTSEKIYIHLKDNGIGIPENVKDKIFNPFFTSKKEGKGTGIGLSISYNLIEEHKGNITFSSSINKGTEFIIELPVFIK